MPTDGFFKNKNNNIPLPFTVLQKSSCAEEDGSITTNINANSATKAITGQLSSVYESCKDTAVEFGTELNTASKELLKGFSRLSLALFGITVSSVNAVSHVVAETGNALTSGYAAISQPIGKIPVIGPVSNGIQNFVGGITETFDDNSKFSTKQRVKMVADMRTNLNEYNPQSVPTAPAITTTPDSTSSDSHTTDAAANV